MRADDSDVGYSIVEASDDDVVVLKAPGLPCALTSDPHRRALEARLCDRLGLPSVHLVHRLDRVSCGIVVVALHRDAAAFHGAQIQARAWTKLYVARIAAEAGQAARLLGAHRRYLRQRGDRTEIVRSGGKPSSLEVTALGPSPGRRGESTALVRLHSGRRHQIRAMLADLGAPLVGDRLYGGPAWRLYLEHALLRFAGLDGRSRLVHVRAPEPDPPFREPWPEPVHQALQAFLEQPGDQPTIRA